MSSPLSSLSNWTLFWDGQTFREAFDLQQSTQRNYYLTKVKGNLCLESFFTLISTTSLVLQHNFEPPGLTHSGASRWVRGLLSPELWGLQSSTSGEQVRLRGNPGPLWPGDQNLNLSSHPQSEDKKPDLLPLWRTSFLTREGEAQQAEPRATLSVITKLNYLCIRLDQAKRLIKAAKAGN